MAAMEYEVRDEYKSYSVAQLLDAPVTCFQGVGEIQSEILERYFGVTTVKELASLPVFLQALNVQETVLEGGSLLEQSVSEAAQHRELGFQVRSADQVKRIAELPEAPVHILDGLTPGQDLAFYDAFRITNLEHLAHNRIMLEARVIDYLAEHGAEAGKPGAGSDAVASILGTRAAAAAAAHERAQSGDFAGAGRMENLASQVTEHVRDRVAAMRDRAWDRAGAEPGARAAGGADRMASIRETRERSTVPGRPAEPTRARRLSRTEEITASRGGGGPVRDVARSVADRRRDIVGDRGSGSRSDSVLAARDLAGRGRPPQASSGGATVRTRPSAGGGGTATATATRPGAPGAPAAGAAAGLKTEQEGAAQAAGAGGTTGAAATRRPARRRQPNPAPLIAAAILVLILIGALIWFLASRPGPEQTDTTAGTGTGQAQPGTEGTAGAPGAGGATGQAGTGAQPGAAGAPGQAAATAGTGQAPAIKGTHTVGRGDTLWFISQKEYADPLNWPSIFLENKDQIRNPDLIYPSQKFRIPATPAYRFPDYPQGYSSSR
jgi:nucleoid-associated protein YgaU